MKKIFTLFLLALAMYSMQAQDTVSITSCTAFWKNDEPVAGANISITVNPPGLPPIAIFGNMGDCATFSAGLPDAFPAGSTFSFTADKDGDDLNGVNVLDLIAMSAHILGIEPLPSPYGILAADANRSNSITSFDIVETRKLILGIYTEFPNNTSWRFFPETCVFPNPNNPFSGGDCPDLTVDDLLTWDGDTLQLIGVKTGDVDGDANPAGSYVGPDFVDSTTLTIQDVQMEAGVPAVIEIKLGGSLPLSGLQTEFHFDPALLEVTSIINTAYFNDQSYGIFSGKMTVAGVSITPMNPGEVLMKIEVTASETTLLSSVFQMAGAILKPIGVTGSFGNPEPVKLKGQYAALATATHVASGAPIKAVVSPNPFEKQAFVRFQLDRPETIRLEVFDLTGQRRHIAENLFPAGAQRLEIPAEAVVPGSMGIYRLQIGQQVVTGKIARFN